MSLTNLSYRGDAWEQGTGIFSLVKLKHSVPDDPPLVHREDSESYLPEQIRMVFHRDHVI